MASKKKKVAKASAKAAAAAKSMPVSAADVASIAKSNPYVQRLIEDAALRDNVQKAIESSKSAYARLSNGKAPHRAIMEDRKLQNDLRTAFEAIRDASQAISDAPKHPSPRKGMGFGRKLLFAGVAGGLALVASENLRSKVLDALFGKEEEFQYTPPPSPPTATPPATPVTSA